MFNIQTGMVCEGPTDFVVIQSILKSLEAGSATHRFFPVTQLQPIASDAFGGFGPSGSGWGGVYRWCRESRIAGKGQLSRDPRIQHMDLIIYHIDYDVSTFSYSDDRIEQEVGDKNLPYISPCPPSFNSIEYLRDVLLSWMGESITPPKTVFCIPAYNTETWVAALLYPDALFLQKDDRECNDAGLHCLLQKGLIKKKSGQYKKTRRKYELYSTQMSFQWKEVTGIFPGAQRFDKEMHSFLAMH